jgi:hypothetical protein
VKRWFGSYSKGMRRRLVSKRADAETQPPNFARSASLTTASADVSGGQTPSDGPTGSVAADQRPPDRGGSLELFADGQDGRPLGDNPFPPDHQAYQAFEEATWKAKEAINGLRAELLQVFSDPPFDFIQAILNFRVRGFGACANAALLIFGNEQTAESYEQWIEDSKTLRGSSLTTRSGKDSLRAQADPNSPVLFTQELLPRIAVDLRLQAMKVAVRYKKEAANRVLQVMALRAKELRADSGHPVIDDIATLALHRITEERVPQPSAGFTPEDFIKSGQPGRQDLLEKLSDGDPNYATVKRFYLESWADSHRLVADGFAGRVSLSDFVESCVKTFNQGARTHVDFRDTMSIPAICRELDVMVKGSISLIRENLVPESERLGKADVDAAIDEYSRRVNEIAARSKQQILEKALAEFANRPASETPGPGHKGAAPDESALESGSAPTDSIRAAPSSGQYSQANPAEGSYAEAHHAPTADSVRKAGGSQPRAKGQLQDRRAAAGSLELSAGDPDKGNGQILRGTDGKLKTAVTLDVARRFGGVSKRAIEKAVKKGSLQAEGKHQNRRISVSSLFKYFPPENNAN